MEPTNPVNQQIPAAQPAPAPLPPASGKKSFGETLNGLREKYKSFSKNTKLLTIVGSIFGLSIVLLLIATVAKRGSSSQVVRVAPSPVPLSSSPVTQYVITNPSRYATDSGVLKIEGDVDNLTRDMDSTDLRSSELRVPILDMDVKYQ